MLTCLAPLCSEHALHHLPSWDNSCRLHPYSENPECRIGCTSHKAVGDFQDQLQWKDWLGVNYIYNQRPPSYHCKMASHKHHLLAQHRFCLALKLFAKWSYHHAHLYSWPLLGAKATASFLNLSHHSVFVLSSVLSVLPGITQVVKTSVAFKTLLRHRLSWEVQGGSGVPLSQALSRYYTVSICLQFGVSCKTLSWIQVTVSGLSNSHP